MSRSDQVVLGSPIQARRESSIITKPILVLDLADASELLWCLFAESMMAVDSVYDTCQRQVSLTE